MACDHRDDDAVEALFARVEASDLKTRLGECAVGYTHGDVNGLNVLLDFNRCIWLLDFEKAGLGQTFTDLVPPDSSSRPVQIG